MTTGKTNNRRQKELDQARLPGGVTPERRDTFLDAARLTFIREYILTGEARSSALKAWPHLTEKGATTKAGRLLSQPHMVAEIDRQRTMIRRETVYTAADAMRECASAMELALATSSAMAYIRAVEVRARINGLLVDRAVVDVNHNALDLAKAMSAGRQRLADRPQVADAQVIQPPHPALDVGEGVPAFTLEDMLK